MFRHAFPVHARSPITRSPMRARSLRPAVLFAVAAIVFAACGGSATPVPTAPASATPAASTPAPASSAPASSAPAFTPTPEPTGPPVTIKWFCCLGGGDDPSTLKTWDGLIKEFNASQKHIILQIDHVAYNGARDAFATRLASGNAPDIIGPLGVGGTNAFAGQWLDISSYITRNNIDLGGFDQGVIDLNKGGGSGQYGLPFAIYPSELYFQPDMFDEVGLNPPPATYGTQYKMPDGTMVDWNYDTVRTVAMKLTLDKNGKSADDPAFDATHIVQYGFEPQRDDLRTMGAAFFGKGKFLSDDGKTVQIPDAWAAAWKWVYKATWTDHFIMTYPVSQGQAFAGGGYTFNSGKVAMQENYLWDVCCVQDAGKHWDLAALPSYNGSVTAPINADTFRIGKDTKHPDEAFTALNWLILGPGKTRLLNSISAFPALKADQPSFFAQLEQQKDDKTGKLIYPPNINWKVVTDAIPFADIDPNSENAMPNYNKSLDTLGKYLTRWTSTAGLDMDAEFAKLKAELQAVWDSK
jgi:multiple sugar transport system substrate-binding protein